MNDGTIASLLHLTVDFSVSAHAPSRTAASDESPLLAATPPQGILFVVDAAAARRPESKRQVQLQSRGLVLSSCRRGTPRLPARDGERPREVVRRCSSEGRAHARARLHRGRAV